MSVLIDLESTISLSHICASGCNVLNPDNGAIQSYSFPFRGPLFASGTGRSEQFNMNRRCGTLLSEYSCYVLDQRIYPWCPDSDENDPES